MAADDLDDEERELLAKHRADRKAKADADSDSVDWWEELPEGGRRGATMSARRAREHGPKWLREFMADQDAAAGDEDKPADDDKPGDVRRFGRRVG